MKNKGFTTIELITSFTLASVIMIILFNIVLILKDNLSKVNTKTNMLIEKDNLSYNINKRFKDKEISSVTTCEDGDKCYLFTYSDDTSDKLIYSNTDKTITFNNYTFNIIDGILVEDPIVTEHHDTMSSTKYNGYFIINVPISLDNKDYSIKVVKYFNTDSLVIDIGGDYYYDKEGNRYTKVEYIEATGEQYIDTKVLTEQSDMSQVASIQIQNNSDQLNGSNDGWWFGVSGRKYGFAGGYKSVYASSVKYDDITLNTYYNSKKEEFIVNDKSFWNNANSYIDRGIGYNIYIFAINNFSSKYFMSARLKMYKIYINDNLVRNYIPVINASERPCLFDKVSRECYYNQGTGEFIWG